MTLNDYICRVDNCIWRIVDNETVILSRDGNNLHRLNEVGSEIWVKADGTVTINEIVNHICSEFDADENRAKIDTLDFIEKLVQKKLITLKKDK